jgi:hypothetical protein
MPAIIKKWTEAEKVLMANTATEIHELMNKKLGKKDIPMHSLVIETVSKAYHDEIAIEKIISLEKNGKDTVALEKKLLQVRKIVEGMQQSDMNLLCFHNSDDCWMQFHMGVFLAKPTFIIAKNSDKAILHSRVFSDLVKKIVFVDDFTKEELDRAMKEIGEEMKK